MALNIKNEEAEQLSRELAGITHESLTAAVTTAVRERLDRVRGSGNAAEVRAARILELGRQISVAMPTATITVEDLYDDDGLPA